MGTIEAFDKIRLGSITDRSQLYKDVAGGPFFGANRLGARVSQGVMDSFWLQADAGRPQEHGRLHQGILRNGFHWRPREVRRADVRRSRRPRPDRADRRRGTRNATATICPGAPHAIANTHTDQLNADLVAFLNTRGRRPWASAGLGRVGRFAVDDQL
jgi:non-heme chloroperoxidase